MPGAAKTTVDAYGPATQQWHCPMHSADLTEAHLARVVGSSKTCIQCKDSLNAYV